MKKFILLASGLLLFQLSPVLAQKNKDKPLEGKSFTINLQEPSSAKPTKPIADEISFKGDKLKSDAMKEKYDFKAGKYTATIDSSKADEDPIITFDAEMEGPGGPDDKLVWHGTVQGEDIEGSAVWTKKGKTKRAYDFSGLLKKKK